MRMTTVGIGRSPGSILAVLLAAVLLKWAAVAAEAGPGGIQDARVTFAGSEVPAGGDLPNIIIIFTDDQGYGDLGIYGAVGFSTPNLDRLAGHGIRFNDFYVAAPVCTPSRAALMTGSYPKRVGLAYRVLFPDSTTGLNPDEVTIAEVLKQRGYATAAIGKWHLGHLPKFLPTRQGFDYFYGIPYSNDMGNFHYRDRNYVSPPLPIFRNEKKVEESPAQASLTRRYTDESVNFIRQNRSSRFFLYLAHSMPHLPIDASPPFKGRSEYGLYGDVIEELDWSVGKIVSTLQELGIEDKTLIIFTSDNGPVILPREKLGHRPGSAGPLRGQKNTTWDGGMREPCIMSWPGRIPEGSISGELVTSMDLLPTIAAIVGAELPKNRILDGKDIRSLIFGEPGAVSPHKAFFYYRDDRLQAVRSGAWKLHVYRPEWGADGLHRPLLYDLDHDVGETVDVADRHPEVVERLLGLVDDARRDLGDAATGRAGENVRPVGTSP